MVLLKKNEQKNLKKKMSKMSRETFLNFVLNMITTYMSLMVTSEEFTGLRIFYCSWNSIFLTENLAS